MVCLVAGCTPVGDATHQEFAAPAAPEESPTESAAESVTDEEPGVEEPPARPDPEPCLGEPAPSQFPVHTDLELRLKSSSPRKRELGQPIDVAVSIRNGSTSQHHPAVLSGDGSEMGWREPHVWYSGFVDAGDGCWQPLEPRRTGRCGMFDEDWRDEVVTLAPGQSEPLQWLASPANALAMEVTGRVRLYAHYAYRAGTKTRGETADLGAMEGIEAFELVSNPIEFELRSPLKLELAARPHRGRGNVSQMADLVTLRLENTARKARRVMPPTANTLEFEVIGEETYHPNVRWQAGDETLPAHRLPGGDAVQLLGASALNSALEVHWYPPEAEVIRIRASYRPYGAVGAPALKSNWVEIDLR